MGKSTEELLSEISSKLDKLMGITAIQNMENSNDKIHVLKQLGFKEPEIKLFVSIKGRIRDAEGWKRK